MAELRTLTRAWVYLLIAYIAVRVLPVPRVVALLEGLSPKEKKEIPSTRLARLVDIAACRHLRPMTCLPRSLALQALLRRHGVSADLLIGVRREAGALRAHAWIEDAGNPVGDPADIRRLFLPLVSSRNAS
ncbi:MAG TPA: lasso peptide biosynthesis B2 protein [Thermoanaerobaculia bacterium]|nr:lasso peptide biosynthesis B2 protein [Thermoanaerobaculia bacterium]